MDLTSSDRFDWRAFVENCHHEKRELICEDDVNNIKRFQAEIHRTAMCPWTGRPMFHFVAYDSSGMRTLISISSTKMSSVLFESSNRQFLSVQQRPVGTTPQPPSPRDKDVCEAFGGRCLAGRQFKAALALSPSAAFREPLSLSVRVISWDVVR